MEEYEDMENDAFGASGAPEATMVTEGQEHKAASQREQIVRQLAVEAERNRFGNAGVLKAASGNVAKRVKMRETRVTTRTGKTVEAAAKQMATQELQMEKARMEEWKRKVMEEVAHELRGMGQAQREAMEAQRQMFQVELGKVTGELEKVTGELEKVKLRSTALEKEREFSRAQKSAQKQNYAPEKLGAKEVAAAKRSRPEEIVEIRDSQSTKSPQADGDTTPAPSSFGINACIHQSIETHKGNSSLLNQPWQSLSGGSRKSYAQVVKENPVCSSVEKPWTEVKYPNKKNVAAKKGVQKQEPGGRRILFPREEGQPKSSEEDIMLALNEALQKAGEPATVRFSRIGYSQSGAISALLTKKAGAKELLEMRKNILIQAAKTIDAAVIGAEALEH